MDSWTKLINCASALEAEILVERLHAAGIDATVRGDGVPRRLPRHERLIRVIAAKQHRVTRPAQYAASVA
jgi:hypothetical protein